MQYITSYFANIQLSIAFKQTTMTHQAQTHWLYWEKNRLLASLSANITCALAIVKKIDC